MQSLNKLIDQAYKIAEKEMFQWFTFREKRIKGISHFAGSEGATAQPWDVTPASNLIIEITDKQITDGMPIDGEYIYDDKGRRWRILSSDHIPAPNNSYKITAVGDLPYGS
jgi:hypothetical protein